jgi:hypothetical protein
MVMVMAIIYTRAGQFDKACDELQDLFAVPSLTSVRGIAADPLFEPLRGYPRYEELLETYRTQSF